MATCSGAPDVCASLRTNVNDALDKAGFRVVASPDRADIAIGAVAGGLQEKVTQQFGQTFPWGTLIINFTGSALLGLFNGTSSGKDLVAIFAPECREGVKTSER